MPNLIKHLTGSGMTIVGVLTAAPYVLCIIGQYYIAKWCDKTMNRRLYTAIPLLGFAVCLALSLLLKDNVWLAYGMMVICGFFLQAYAGPFWTLPPLLFAPTFWAACAARSTPWATSAGLSVRTSSGC